jgi:hypothetical protein
MIVAYLFITTTGWVLLALLDAAVCGFFGAWITERGDRSAALGGILGFVFGPLGVVAAAALAAGEAYAQAPGPPPMPPPMPPPPPPGSPLQDDVRS